MVVYQLQEDLPFVLWTRPEAAKIAVPATWFLINCRLFTNQKKYITQYIVNLQIQLKDYRLIGDAAEGANCPLNYSN